MSEARRRRWFWVITFVVPLGFVLLLALISFHDLDSGTDARSSSGTPTTGLSAEALERRVQAEENRVRGALKQAEASPGGVRGAIDVRALDGGERPLSEAGNTDALGADGGAQLKAWMEKNADEAKRSVKKFCEENEALAKDPLFPETKEEHDAAVYMLPRIDWEGPTRPKGLLHLAAPLEDRIKAAGNDWPTRLNVKDLEGLDFSWMTEILQFDTWSSGTFGPLRDDTRTEFFEAPIPNYISLMQWAKLRYVRALAAPADLPAAIREVRQLAMLTHSQQLVIGDAVAQVMLRFEVRAREAAVAMGVNVSDWPPLDSEQLMRFRRVALAGPFFFAPGVDDETVKQAGACLKDKCSALIEGLGFQSVLRPWAPRDNSAAVNAVADAAKCSKFLYDKARAARPAVDESVSSLRGVDRLAELFGDAGIPPGH